MYSLFTNILLLTIFYCFLKKIISLWLFFPLELQLMGYLYSKESGIDYFRLWFCDLQTKSAKKYTTRLAVGSEALGDFLKNFSYFIYCFIPGMHMSPPFRCSEEDWVAL